jgi:signal transduction histidine kinase
MNKILVVFLSLLLLIVACGSGIEKQVKALEKEVIAVHDEVMPKMTEISFLRQTIQKKAAAFAADSTKMDSLLYYQGKGAVVSNNLTRAEDAMNKWMVDFHEVTNQKVKPEEMLDLLKGEQTKINEVKDMMLSSIKEAKAFLGNE